MVNAAGAHSRKLRFRKNRGGVRYVLVQVQWTNDRFDYVKVMLGNLIEAGVVTKFLRSSGWVTIGVDPVRSGTPVGCYVGIERRFAFCLMTAKPIHGKGFTGGLHISTCLLPGDGLW